MNGPAEKGDSVPTERDQRRLAIIVASVAAGIVVGLVIVLFVLPGLVAPPLRSYVSVTSVSVTWDPGNCNSILFPGPPQYAKFSFQISNSGGVDVLVQLNFLIDNSVYDRATYLAPAGHSTPPISATVTVQDCLSHSAAIDIADVFR